jgi:hypothetical protein
MNLIKPTLQGLEEYKYKLRVQQIKHKTQDY